MVCIGGLLENMDGPGKWNETHPNQWNPSIFNQAHLKRTPMVAWSPGVGGEEGLVFFRFFGGWEPKFGGLLVQRRGFPFARYQKQGPVHIQNQASNPNHKLVGS